MRLTIKNRKGQYKVCGKCGEPIDLQPAFNKLGKIENIEQELGIDLITLFKALKNGVYYRNTQIEINFAKKVRLSFAYKTLVVDRHICKYLTDYGKTWSLRKEDLEQ